MDKLFDQLDVIDVHDDLFRNIVSIRESQDVFDDLSDDDRERQTLADHEMRHKPGQFVSDQPIINRPFEEAAFNEAIQYPFDNWQSSRYSDGSHGVWYGAGDLETSIYETVYHWRHGFLHDAGWQDHENVVGERKVYLVRCDALLFDFRLKIESHPALIAPENYHLTHQIGRRIHYEGAPGLVSRSVHGQGSVYVIFHPRVLSIPRQYCYLTYTLNGGAVNVERKPGITLLVIGKVNS